MFENLKFSENKFCSSRSSRDNHYLSQIESRILSLAAKETYLRDFPKTLEYDWRGSLLIPFNVMQNTWDKKGLKLQERKAQLVPQLTDDVIVSIL